MQVNAHVPHVYIEVDAMPVRPVRAHDLLSTRPDRVEQCSVVRT